jgi:hypothetical protein
MLNLYMFPNLIFFIFTKTIIMIKVQLKLCAVDFMEKEEACDLSLYRKRAHNSDFF